jgi:hypothetical protein
MRAQPASRRTGRTWLLLAGLLFAAGAFLAALFDKPATAPPRVKVPRMDRDAWTRLQRRRTLPAIDQPADPFGGRAPRPRDPMIAALPPAVKKAAVVIEANAIRYSPVGEMLVACLLHDGGGDYERMKKQMGVDLLKDVDRVAFVDGTIMVSGFFAGARWDAVVPGAVREPLDEHAVLWRDPQSERAIGVWKDSMAMFGTRAEISAAFDRLEGRATDAAPVLSESDSYGELYGVVAPEAIGAALALSDPGLADRLRSVASAIRLHVDASHDVGIVAEVTGEQAEPTHDLARAVGAGLVLARLQAAQKGETDLAEVLDFAKVTPSPSGASFEVEVGLPLSLFQRHLEQCMSSGAQADAGTGAGG